LFAAAEASSATNGLGNLGIAFLVLLQQIVQVTVGIGVDNHAQLESVSLILRCAFRPRPVSDPRPGRGRSGQSLERVVQALPSGQHALEQIAMLLDSPLDDLHRELCRV
jgi:hypothetical protein